MPSLLKPLYPAMALIFSSLAASCAADSAADGNLDAGDDLADLADVQADSTSDESSTDDAPDTQPSDADDTAELGDVGESDANADAGGDTTTVDDGEDSSGDADFDAAEDVSDTTADTTDTSDATEADVTDATDTSPGEDTTDASDVEADAPAVDLLYPEREVGQCYTDAVCPDGPGGRSCNGSAPGGICIGCTDETVCPGAAECYFGTCVTMCSAPDDCPPGFVCGGTGRCGIQSCVDDVCPNPLYTCDVSNRCARVDCSDGATCPTGTACTGGWCVELRMLPL